MKSRDPYQQALATLADALAAGRFGWGLPLVATDLAAEIGLSPTPMREALARLAGEGLIEHHPGRGYFSPSPGPDDIVDLYRLHQKLTDWALETIASRARPPDSEAITPTIHAVFAALVSSTGDRILTSTFARTSSRLRPIRAVEDRSSPVSDVVRLALVSAWAFGDVEQIRTASDRYHHDRIGVSEAVFKAMRVQSRNIEAI